MKPRPGRAEELSRRSLRGRWLRKVPPRWSGASHDIAQWPPLFPYALRQQMGADRQCVCIHILDMEAFTRLLPVAFFQLSAAFF